jgi:hypothetical protein
MVNARGPRGASATGCLVSLLILAAGLYYGVNIGQVYVRYYRLLDTMKTQARLAAALDNGTIQRHIQAAIMGIGVPAEAGTELTITRTPSPREITIETTYRESVHLLLFDHTYRFHPKATAPL